MGEVVMREDGIRGHICRRALPNCPRPDLCYGEICVAPHICYDQAMQQDRAEWKRRLDQLDRLPSCGG